VIDRLKKSGRTSEPPEGSMTGTARVDGRTKRLVGRLQPGEIAVIDHRDIDRISAESLIQRQARAVVNAAKSASGRYPNLGPILLCSAGIALIDDAGPEVMRVPEGSRLILDDGKVLLLDGSETVEVARGKRLDLEAVERKLDDSKRSISSQIEEFAENTMEYIRGERDVMLEAARLPDVRTDFHGRHVLVVVRGYHYKEDLKALRAYVRELRPLLIGVDGGADALVEFGLKPDMIIGDMDSVTTETLESGAELVVHAYPGGTAPGLDRIEALHMDAEIFEATGTSEDIAMLLAFERGAELIVAVGTHANLVEFMDKGRKGMASTFLTRLRVGPILVDAKGISRLYRTRIRRRDLLMLIGAALITMAVVVAVSEPMRLYLRFFWNDIQELWFSIRRALF
jgi:uncharacterized membrane-anchored protein